MVTLEEAIARSSEVWSAYKKACAARDTAKEQLAAAEELVQTTMNMGKTVFTTCWGSPMLQPTINQLMTEAQEKANDLKLSREERSLNDDMVEMLSFITSWSPKEEESK